MQNQKVTKFNIPLSYYSDIEENKFIKFISDEINDSIINNENNNSEYSFLMDF